MKKRKFFIGNIKPKKVKNNELCCSLGDTAECTRLRAQLAILSPITLPDGTRFIFHNKLSYYDTLICIDAHHPTIDQLNIISNALFINGKPLCPLLIWATRDGNPTLVKVRPGHNNPVKIIPTTDIFHLAYSVWVLSNDKNKA